MVLQKSMHNQVLTSKTHHFNSKKYERRPDKPNRRTTTAERYMTFSVATKHELPQERYLTDNLASWIQVHVKSIRLLWSWKAGLTQAPQLHCNPAQWKFPSRAWHLIQSNFPSTFPSVTVNAHQMIKNASRAPCQLEKNSCHGTLNKM
jgi:hypothetical protein